MAEKIPRCVDVAVPLPVRDLYTYRVTATLRGCSDPGARAVVPFGRRLVTGVIVRDGDGSRLDAAILKDVASLPDAAPLLPSDLLDLALWAARYYVAAPGSLLRAALPPGLGRRSETSVARVAPEPAGARERLSPEDRLALTALPVSGAVPLRRLGLSPAALRRLRDAGLVTVAAVLAPPRVGEKTVWRARAANAALETLLAQAARAPRQWDVLRTLAEAGAEGMRLDDLRDRLGPIAPAVKALRGKCLLILEREAVRREPPVLEAEAPPAPRDATPGQASASGAVFEALETGAGGAFLLMGVTGSGKTEVYLRAVQRCLAAGRDVLYLVPEIALTPLLARDLKARLGGRLAILHSSLRPGERFDEWRRARGGQASVVLGPRSAVLAPVGKLGLIVVDEEQDASYKQQEDPRYNARDLALVRARDARAVALLGSATPSVETYYAAVAGRLRLLRLPGRVLERPMARVRVVDMREEFSRTGRDDLISEPLREAVACRLTRGEQAIILLNRRGYAPFVLCRRCGSSETCLRCSVALTYHRAGDRLRCHYCGYARGRPAACSTCRSPKIVLAGAGTEKLEEQLREAFPSARLARLDRDAARGRLAPAAILSAFERREFNLLAGTQMVAKGHDFPGVTIVGVVGADTMLALPDFRAAERTFQLLTQVAGRSGRGEEPGEVIVQVFDQDHYAVTAAAAQDYMAFYERESRFRRVMRYPPFVVMANLIVQASSPDVGVRRSRLLGEVVRAAAGADMSVLGPSVAPLARLKGRYRYQVLVKAASRRRLSDALNEAARALASKGLSSPRDLVIDMDPVSLF